MTNLSRKEKYKQLREQLQHDIPAGEVVNTPELSRFTKKLNEIAPENFAAPGETVGSHDANHVKVEESLEEIASQIEEQASRGPAFDMDTYRRNENDSDLETNDVMDEVIREVKQYNIENGNALSQNTSLNIMQEIKGINTPAEKPKAPSRPFPQEKRRNDTADIPFMSPFRDYDETDDTENLAEITDEAEEEQESSQTMSREDIMAEVQSLVAGKPLKKKARTVDEQLYSQLEDDRTTRQRLLNETTQMRAQLDGYEDNLSEVNDKMRYTNRILNLVLIVLIIALVVIMFILIYWVVLSRGA